MSKKGIPTILVVFVVIAILLLFFVPSKTIEAAKQIKIPEDFKDTKEEANHKHKRLKEHLEKQSSLKLKLAKKFKWIYFGVRIGLVGIWIGIMLILAITGLIKDLEGFLNYSEASILILITANFLTFGKLSNLNNYLDLIKVKTENWVYGKYINLDEKIEENNCELLKLEIETSVSNKLQA